MGNGRRDERTVYVNREDPDFRHLRDWADAGLEIANAPRPLAGQKGWQGPFMHGVFYVASTPDMAALVRGGCMGWDALDAYPVRVVDNAFIQAQVQLHLDDAGMTLAEALECWEDMAGVAKADGWPWWQAPGRTGLDVLDAGGHAGEIVALSSRGIGSTRHIAIVQGE